MVALVDCLTGLTGASVSALAKERNGDFLVSLDPDRALAPASNTKLVTSILALKELGPTYTFNTCVTGYGRLQDNRLSGNLVLDGSGAPDLEKTDLATLADAVASDVTVVGGDLVLDGRQFTGGYLGPGWTVGDQRHAYGAGSSAIALTGNTVEIRVVDPDEMGEFHVSLVPDSAELAVETDLEVVEAGDYDIESDSSLHAFTSPKTGIIHVEGTLPRGAEQTVRVPVSNPEHHCGLVFREALEIAGVTVSGEVRSIESSNIADHVVFSHSVESDPISDLLRSMNVSSDNFIAEQLARTVSAEHGDGSWKKWSDIATEFLYDCGAAACRLQDGSGLSRYNLATARGFIGLLEQADNAPWSDVFFNSLPETNEGTLSSRLDDVDGLRAKTGTITGTSALSGVVRHDDRPDVYFSIIYGGLTDNVAEARHRQDDFVRALL